MQAAAQDDPVILERLGSLRKLEREQRHLAEQVDARLRAESRRERRVRRAPSRRAGR